MTNIPRMTSPDGLYWRQPPGMHELNVNGTHAILTRAEFDGLPEYSSTMPTGVYPGKCWKWVGRDGSALLCWFGIVLDNDKVCSNNMLPIALVDPWGLTS